MAFRRMGLRGRPKRTTGLKGLRLLLVDGQGVVPGQGRCEQQHSYWR